MQGKIKKNSTDNVQFVNYTFIILGDEQWFSDILESPGRRINVYTPGTNLSDVSVPVQQ